MEPHLKLPEDQKAFQKWVMKWSSALNSENISLRLDEPVIEFEEGTKEMTVTFNPQLVSLCEETFQLAAYGFEIPDNMAQLVKTASRLLMPAKNLAEIARFHNTVGETMIRSQRPMMLDEAVALSKAVKEQNQVTWKNPKEVQIFIDKLMDIVRVLGQHNEYLSRSHYRVIEKVNSLFDSNLVKQHKKWKSTMKEIKEVVKEVEDSGFKNMKGWLSHIDHQLYKVLDAKYRHCLLTISDILPEFKVEVIYANGSLQFKPALEDMRITYRNHVKKVVNIPAAFEGVAQGPEFFAPISSSNFVLSILKIILVREDKLFDRLEQRPEKFLMWIEREEDLSEKEISADDWENKFRRNKQRSQDIATLNFDDEKVGCFTVSYRSLRLDLETQNRESWDTLSKTLTRSVSQSIQKLKLFLNDATEQLNQDPQSLEDITQFTIIKEKVGAQMNEMQGIKEECENKNKVLSTWTRGAFDMDEIKMLWRDFEDMLSNHEKLLGRQIENIKINLKSDVQSLGVEMNNFKLKWDELKPKDGSIMKQPEKLDKAIAYINQMEGLWENLKSRKIEITGKCESLGVPPIDLSVAEEVEQDLQNFQQIWGKLSGFRTELKKFEDEEWIIFRAKPYLFEEFLEEWDSKLRQEENKSDFVLEMIKEIQEYKAFVPNLKFLRGENFTEKHWAELLSIAGISQKSLADLKASDFFFARQTIIDKIKDLKELNGRATGEIAVRQALNELDAWEIDAKFQLAEHKDSKNQSIRIVQDFKSVLNKLGDNHSLIQSIRTSPFYSHFADRISIWETKLADLDEYIQNLNKIQRRWVYLEPVFTHGVLEAEQTRFRRINEDFRSIMREVENDNRVASLLKISGVRGRLSTLIEQLQRCQNSLNEFLERKRSGFPRFYFIGDDDLLEILGQSTRPNVIQAHLKKLFAGIYNVDFDDQFRHITTMKSLEGEVVPLKNPVKVTSNVEEWLNELSNEMRLTLKSMLLDSLAESKRNTSSPHKYPSQILGLSNSIIFTEMCEEAIRSSSLSSFLSDLRKQLDSYTGQNMTSMNDSDKVLELKLKDLILDVIHQIDVVEYLIGNNVRQVSDWHWQKQLRFYIGDGGDAVIRMANAEFQYSYEYQGNAQKLVHTSLTDKCFLTLTQGMRMGLGGNPYGPAGTGKTESVKALGTVLGRQVLVFNCDEGIDVTSMGRIFTGLVKCGAWGCFDEFNRLDGLTLSAISLQIQQIQMALKRGDKEVTLMDERITLDAMSGIFVTLNPAGQGYGGRNKLPDNLKQLFRPVIMSQPDNDKIAEVILYAEGFKFASVIGQKLVELYRVAAKLLTPQQHYDWGLRALKTVLKGCGSALADFKKRNESSVSESDEFDIVVATLRLNTLPKLTYSDRLRFDSIVKDVMVNAVFKELGNLELKEHVEKACEQMQLKVQDNQVQKCLELYEQLQQRMGIVIVGPPSCGKSTIVEVLRRAMLNMGHQVKTHVLNPKAMPRVHLLGQINLDTRQWTDGVLTMKAQQVYSEPPEITSWIICDGDIDPEWVESLNSVLDDNRLLTLPSGWRIKFGPNVNFIFETHDLSLASPATISRMGMIFMSEEDANVNYVVDAWLGRKPSEEQGTLRELLERNLPKSLSLLRTISDPAIPIPYVSAVQNALSLMHGVKSNLKMVEALIRGLGGHLQIKQMGKFANELLKIAGQPEMSDPIHTFYNTRSDRLETYSDEGMSDTDSFTLEETPLVKTANVRRVLDSIRPWLENQESFLLVGPEGCGKSMILNHAFSQLRSVQISVIHCSGLTSPESVLQKLSQICITMSTNTGRIYKSKDSERLILFFKDINLVKPDKWGTCQLVEFLRQIIVLGGFYDTNLEWVTMQGIQIVGSISMTEIGRFPLSPRFTSRVRICTMSEPETKQLSLICTGYLSSLTKSLWPANPITKNLKQMEALANGMVRVYEEVRKTFTPVEHPHYLFTPRDLTMWSLGLMRYSCEEKNDVFFAWCYEACRIFRDKLVLQEGKQRFVDAILLPVASQWGISTLDESKLGSWWISSLSASVVQPKSPTPLEIGPPLTKINKPEVEAIIDKGMTLYSREEKHINLAIIKELIESVCRIDRILTFPCSSLVLAGRAGVGRKSALYVIAALHRASVKTLRVGRNYTMKSFKNDLKTAILTSAIEGNHIFYVIEDFQLVSVSFLDMLNSLLSCGEIPGLYSPEELETLLSSLRDAASNDDYSSNLHNYFAQRIRRYLHIILIMDYTNENFVKNCQSNPALYKQCRMIWFDEWSDESMLDLPVKIINKIYTNPSTLPDMKLDCMYGLQSKFLDENARSLLVQGFKGLYSSVGKSMRYPRRYVNLIYNYIMIYRSKKQELANETAKLQAGIKKLEEATTVVQKLKAEAVEQETILAEKQTEANKAMNMITVTLQSSNVQKGELEELRIKTEKEKEDLAQKKASIDAELAEIEPMVKTAQAAVGNIKNESLSEIRSLRAPPDIVRDILEGVLRLMGTKDMSWNSMKTFLAKRGVKDEIRNFDARNIDSVDREAVEKLLQTKKASFEVKNAKRASAAAAPLAEWVNANVKFAKVLEKIEPLEKYKQTLERNLQIAESDMHEISSGLTTVEERVQALTERYKQCSSEAVAIQFNLDKAKATLEAAEGLVGKLNDEFTRWQEELHELETDFRQLPFEVLMAAGFITFLSNVSEDLRKEFVTTWSTIVGLEAFDFCKLLAKERAFLQWQTLGLPTDKLSRENAIVVTQTCLRPYIVDPSNRATDWLIKHLSTGQDQPPAVVSIHDPKFTSELEFAVRFGKIMIIIEVDTIEPILIPILRGDVISNGSRELVPVGEKNVDFNSNFKLFLATRNQFPVIIPDAEAAVTVVNFTTTRAGLTNQLLSATLASEHPDLSKKNEELVKSIEHLKMQKEELASTLLRELANAEGNILENKELLASLNETKARSLEITESLQKASEVEEEMTREIDVYRPFAEFGSRLHFAVGTMSQLNPMYQFSLNGFLRLFSKTLDDRSSGTNVKQRIAFLKGSLFENIYEYVCKALYKTDRMAFALYLARNMFPTSFKRNEWEAFTGQLLLTSEEGGKTVPSWIPEDRRFAMQIFMATFPELYDTLEFNNYEMWSTFWTSNDCEEAIPQAVRGQLSPFEQLLIINILRPDRLHTAMYNFARTTFGRKSLYPPPPSIQEVARTSSPDEPILLLSLGADPSQEIREVGESMLGSGKYFEIQLGHGPTEEILHKLRSASEQGHWACIKNLHLVTNLLDQLEKQIKTLQPHPHFRLWLTSEPHSDFPKMLAQSCFKIAYEAPQGVKKNLQRTCATWTPAYFTGSKHTVRCQSLFVLAVFHAIVQERRTYIPQGWSTFYEFNDSDLRAGADVIEQLFRGTRVKDVQWIYIQGIFENVIYGGRVDNEYDNRVLVTYLKEYFNDQIITGANPSRKAFGPNITLPSSTMMEDYLDRLDAIPENDRPSFFGLPGNIEKTLQKTTSSHIISQLKILSRGITQTMKFDKIVWSKELTPIMFLWKKLAQGSSIHTLLQKTLTPPELTEKDVAMSPVDSFVQLEHYRILVLIQRVHKSLGFLSRIIRGVAVPNDEAFVAAEALMAHHIPTSWSSLWDGPTVATEYITRLVEKATRVNEVLLPRTQQATLLDQAISLSDFINPDAFFVAFKQHCARKKKVPMDELELSCSWDSSGNSSDKLRCVLKGIYLEGCSYKGGKFYESNPEDPSSCEMPACSITWTPAISKSKNKEAALLDHSASLPVPLYANESRRKLVGCLNIPVQGEEAKWIKTGIALFLR